MIGLGRHVRDRSKTRSDGTKEYIVFDYDGVAATWDPVIRDSLFGNRARVVVENPTEDYTNAVNGLRYTGTVGGTQQRTPFVVHNVTSNLLTNSNYMSGGTHTIRFWSRDWSKTTSQQFFSPYVGSSLRINSDLDLSSCTNFGALLNNDTMRLGVYTGCTNIIFPTNNHTPGIAVSAIDGGGFMSNIVLSGMPNMVKCNFIGFTRDLYLNIGTNTAPYFDFLMHSCTGYDSELDLSGVQNLRSIVLANAVNVGLNRNITSIKLPNTPTSVNPTSFQLYAATLNTGGDIIVDPAQPNHLFLNNIYTAITTNNFVFTTGFNPSLTGITFPPTSNTWGYIWIQNCNLTGNLDLSPLSNFGSTGCRFTCVNNPNLTSITYPYSTQVFNEHFVNNCNITGTLDFTNLQKLGNQLAYNNNPNLTGVTHTATTVNYSRYWGYSCNLTGNLDLSILENYIRGDIRLQVNPNLTGITISTTGATTVFLLNNCNITGTLDMSTVTDLKSNFQVQLNTNLTNIINPSNSNTFSSYFAFTCNLGYIDFTTLPNMTSINGSNTRLESNGMTATEVNHILVDLDSISVGGFTSRVINIGGVVNPNAAPDGTSGGFDGLTAKANLISKGFTVTTN